MNKLFQLLLAALQPATHLIGSICYAVIWVCTVWLEFKNDRGRCRDAVVFVPIMTGTAWLLCLMLTYWAYFATLPVVFWAVTASLTLYGLGGTMHVVGELQERMRWLRAVRSPANEHWN